MDTDGSADKNGICSLSTKSLGMACDAQRLARSLGLKAGLRAHEAKLNGKNYGYHYLVSFVPPEGAIVFRLKRKQERIRYNQNSRSRNRYVAAVKQVGPRTVKCIQVEGNIYLVGQAFIPTHNSSITSVAWPAWTWAQSRIGPCSGPHVQFLSASYAQTLSLRDSVKTRRLIESPWYKTHWGSRFSMTSDVNTKGRYENNKGGYRIATSVDGSLTGEGGQIILIDDPHNATEVESDLVRKSTLQWWDEAMSTRLNDPETGAYVIIMQRLHQEDLTGHVITREKDNWTWLMLPMEHEKERHCITYVKGTNFWEDPRTNESELLCPERFSKESVVNLSKRLGEFAAAGQLQQSPIPRGGGIIKFEWWKKWTEPRYPVFDFVLASLDTAYTEKEENDPSALTIWGVFQENGNPKIMLIYGWQDRLSLSDLVEKVLATCSTAPLPETSKYRFSQRFRVDRLLIENKAAGISVYQEIHRLFSFSGQFGTELYNQGKNGGDKWARVQSIQHLFSEGLVYVPWPTIKTGPDAGKESPDGYKWAEEVVDQITIFPRGSHDDFVDTMSMALRYLRDTALVVRHEEAAHATAEEMAFRSKTSARSLYPV